MYISYMDKKNNCVVTEYTNMITKKNKQHLESREQCLYYLYDKALELLENGDISKRYRTEYRIKRNKTKRRIDIPDEELMKYQKEMVYILNNKLEFLFPEWVYGYVKGRNTKAMAEIHRNQQQVIKLDIKNFFPSCTLQFIMNSMSKIYPFCLLDKELIETIIKPCMVFYDGEYRLPQGAPTSPILSNIAMIPLDCTLNSMIKSRFYTYTYTRFADDIVISHGDFYFPRLETTKEKHYEKIRITKKVIIDIENLLKQYNFYINSRKTKVLNTECGNVWMLGVTVGEKVKIGNKKKQRLKASLWNFLNDCKNGNTWSEKDTRHMLGILGYAKYIEPDFVIKLIFKYEQKTGINFQEQVKKILCS